MAPYVATDHEVWGLIDAMRIELLQMGWPVAVSLVAPGRTASGLTQLPVDAARERGGEEAVKAYEATGHIFQARADAIIAAMPAGQITI